MPPLLDDLAAVWHPGFTPADLALFLLRHADTPPDDRVAAVCFDRSKRTDLGLPVPLAEYFRLFPFLNDTKIASHWLADQTLDSEPGGSENTSTRSVGGRPVDPLATRSVDDGTYHDPADVPETLGRYVVVRVLGRGAFGLVLLARDTELNRMVAVKVPHRHLIRGPEDIEKYLAEARTLAMLDHPGIVPVHDVGRTSDGRCFVVSKYVEGESLADRIQTVQLSPTDAAVLLATVSAALDHAHRRGLVHRDVKPANILLDAAGTAYVADFGLAVRTEELVLSTGLAGTPAYMSPEQARGEGHRVDRRSDVFSVGVVLYELLTGRRPFDGPLWTDVLKEIITAEPLPPRQIHPGIPKELERICLKAIAKRGTDRYASALDLAEDLKHFLGKPARGDAPSEASAGPQVVPKGLRSFDAADADFFLSLLPGPFSRDGLPESLRFWKSRIEADDPAQAVAVGLLYGPSGCGKSSLMKAGLLPRLSVTVRTVYVEATAGDTEARLLAGVRKAWPGLPPDGTLADALAAVRRGVGPLGDKLLLVIDQFEQWLHAHPAAGPDDPLVRGLRHCDGARVQAVLLVRDDFWLGTTRFLRDLEVRLVEGQNCGLVDLFDAKHARKVLAEFGRAFGCLPADSPPTAEQDKFLDQAVEALSNNGKVISVRLSLFAEMVKGKAWVPATLRAVGGAEGVGVTFLEETFAAPTAPPGHRVHLTAVRAVLKALLPEPGADIKGRMRPADELRTVAGYAAAPTEFDDLMQILDGELKLVTPTEAPDAGTGYQLTHDYLVPSLRQWLTRKQQETRRGRAELRLAEQAALYRAKPESRFLPSLTEWAGYLLWTHSTTRTEAERKLMTAATRRHGTALAVASVFAVLFAVGVPLSFAAARVRQDRETATGLVQKLGVAETAKVPEILDELAPVRAFAVDRLKALADDETRSGKARLHARLGLLPDDPATAAALEDQLLAAEADEFLVIRQLLLQNGTPSAEKYAALLGPAADAGRRFRAAAALAGFAPDRVPDALAPALADQLLAYNPVYLNLWVTAFAPVKAKLRDPLFVAAEDPLRTADDRRVATSILADYFAADPDTLLKLLAFADDVQFLSVAEKLKDHRAEVLPRLQAEVKRTLAPDWRDPPGRPDPPPEVCAAFAAAFGYLDGAAGFTLAMPAAEAATAVDTLRPLGYRPTHFRPFRSVEGTKIAAAFVRDGRSFRLATDLPADAVRDQDNAARSGGFAPLDVAVDRPPGATEPRYAVVWVHDPMASKEAILKVGLTDVEFEVLPASFEADADIGHAPPRPVTRTVFQSPAGRVNAGIWWPGDKDDKQKPTEGRGSRRWFADRPWGVNAVRDVRIDAVTADPDLIRARAAALAKAEEAARTQPKDKAAQTQLAEAAYAAGDYTRAKAAADAALDLDAMHQPARRVRILAEARNGRAAAMQKLFADFKLTSELDGWEVSYFEAVLAACDGKDENACRRLLSDVGVNPDSGTWHLFGARALALAATVCPNPARKAKHADAAAELFARAVRLGIEPTPNADHPDFDAVRSNPKFQTACLCPGRGLEFGFLADPAAAAREYVVVSGPAEQVAAKAAGLRAEGYRPACVAARPPETEGLTAAVVWDRPTVTDTEADKASVRRANAALAVARLDNADHVWSLLRADADPRLRTQLLHRFAPEYGSAQPLADRLALEPDPAVRQALLMALGSAPPEKVPPATRAATAQLAARAVNDPHPGVHFAAEWLLRTWNLPVPTPKPPPAADWFTTRAGHGMAVVRGPVFYRAGSPAGEAGRGANEHFTDVALNRSFAVGVAEVTQEQLNKFRAAVRAKYATDTSTAAQRLLKVIAEPAAVTEAGVPATGVTYLEAAAYCRWLSEQEGVADIQMCLPKIEECVVAERVKFGADTLAKSGYRLPMVAEWEYAARAGTATARYFGSDNDLLPRYARFAYNSKAVDPSRRRTDLAVAVRDWSGRPAKAWPVGQLLPNPLGLFDVYGNADEWCLDYEGTDGDGFVTVGGREIRYSSQFYRSVRGGNYASVPDDLRAAARSVLSASYLTSTSVGFRIARTMPPPAGPK